MRTFKTLFTFILLTAIAATAAAQSATPKPESKLFDAGKLIKDIEILSSDEMEGRSPDRPSIAKAREHIKKRFSEAGLKPLGSAYEQEFDIKIRGQETPVKGINYVGLIAGKKKADKYIVITAHYDHLGVRNSEVFNGADDNASGTAALFAIAAHFKKSRPDHSLIFVALDAEERGFVGARHFVANPPVAKESIVLNINMDMVSRSEKGELYAVGTSHYPNLKPSIEAAQKKAPVKLLLGHDTPGTGRDDWTNQSDQAAFHAAKIPFIYFGVEDHKDYHRPTDDFENIHPEFYVKAVETVIEAVQSFDKSL